MPVHSVCLIEVWVCEDGTCLGEVIFFLWTLSILLTLIGYTVNIKVKDKVQWKKRENPKSCLKVF